jgi:hypothetical protein
MAKFRYTDTPSTRFGRAWDFKQSDIPSQYMKVPPPFDPIKQPDQTRRPPPNVVDWGIVRSVFDVRPPRAFDFFFQLFFSAGTDLTGGFPIPAGYVLFLRSMQITVYPLQTGDNLHPTITVDQYGFSDNTANLIILLDKTPVSTWTPGLSGTSINDIFNGSIDFDTFILGGSGQTLNISIPGVTSLASAAEMTCVVHLYGNLVFATGRSLENEPGNADPEPVHEF